MFHYSPRSVILSFQKTFPSESMFVTSSNMRHLVHRFLEVNRDYSLETIDRTLHYLIDTQSDELWMKAKLHDQVKENVREWFEDSGDCSCFVLF